ncbi:FadR/GntR family transcriptional regulator [Paenibacillus sp. OAS669]|uniref:FadR/GntR family transcriptional regulator n=1 Tax=Paenibacillus sp. OAS669 TaxID=2663821 RepID=UPI00178AA95B|nr:FadR/GntR family transcriptional regulator [Paenibacillus sp. OAS669]MBE1443040.1 DNA-binding FadR family transcriptional regulator [Paenibacillus sp. OAS669]
MNKGSLSFQTVKRKQIVDDVVEQLQRKISLGELSPGMQIPTEPELMEQFGVGRSTIREAVRVLVSAGLLDKRQGHGTFVCQQKPIQEPLDYRLRRAEILEVYEVRRMMEIEAARLAADRRDDEDLRVMRELLDQRQAAIDSGRVKEYLDADIAYHIAVAAATKNAVLADLYRIFSEVLRHSLENLVNHPQYNQYYTEQHEKIYEAIRDKDVQAAELYSMQHLDGTRTELEEHIKS